MWSKNMINKKEKMNWTSFKKKKKDKSNLITIEKGSLKGTLLGTVCT